MSNGFVFPGIIGNANIINVGRAHKWYAEAMDDEEASLINRKAGRPSLSSSHETPGGLTTRSNSEPYLKDSYIICQVPDGSFSKVEFEAT